MSTSSPGTNQSGLARIAFNIYGSFGSNDRQPRSSEKPKHPITSKKLTYLCDREITSISQLHLPLGRLNSTFYDPSAHVPSHHVIIGGKNYLRLLALNQDQSNIIADINLIESHTTYSKKIHTSSKIFNVNTIKAKGDLVACGLANGSVNIYQIATTGKSKLAYRLDDHKRVVNSLDFVDQEQLLLSGSQDGTVRLWDLRVFNQKPVVKLMPSQHSDPVRSCQYSPFSKVKGRMSVLSVHDSGALCKYDLRYPNSSNTRVTLPEKKWTFHTGPALSLHIHPESEYVLTGGRDKKVCVWNYGDTSPSSMSPEIILNTHGPVMKIRWNETSNEGPSLQGYSDIGDELASQQLGLYKYDFACSYLNDDPSITVYNLARPYIPKEIVTTSSGKPIQNFIWSKSLSNERKLWTITKSNAFVSYDLNSDVESGMNITRPLESLPPVVTSWNSSLSEFTLVSQNSNNFDMTLCSSGDSMADYIDRNYNEETKVEIDRISETHSSPISFDASSFASRPFQSTFSNNQSQFQYKTQNSSPKERPLLHRSATQISQTAKSTSFNSHRPDMTHTQSLTRPYPNRNPSQSTLESVSSSVGTSQQPSIGGTNNTRRSQHNTAPFIATLSLPVPILDDQVFDFLACEYLIDLPDGFTLSAVCELNASSAANVKRYRDCQTWRMISAAVKQEDDKSPVNVTDSSSPGSVEAQNSLHPSDGPTKQIETKEFASEFGNVVGSYNSDSTSTTNYGSVPRIGDSISPAAHMVSLGSSKESFPIENSARNSKGSASHEALGDESNSGHSGAISKSFDSTKDNHINTHSGYANYASVPRSASMDPAHNEHSQALNIALNDKRHIQENQLHQIPEKGNSIRRANSDIFEGDGLSTVRNIPISNTNTSIIRSQSFSNLSGSSQDLDNENLNSFSRGDISTSSNFLISPDTPLASINNMHRLSASSKESQLASSYSVCSNESSKMSRNLGAKRSAKNFLDRVDELSTHSNDNRSSKLTKAITEMPKTEKLSYPWRAISIIEKALEYALAQGDIVMSSSLILLFYDQWIRACMTEDTCLEVLGTYVETLRKKGLYTIAVQVVKIAPQSLKARLDSFATRELGMRFFCCWCQKLLSNEVSKAKYSSSSDKYGFWYCDECSRRQSNCIYCNEPCRGLAVVESLRCGHRGHFGCFQEWHIDEAETECPAGCE